MHLKMPRRVFLRMASDPHKALKYEAPVIDKPAPRSSYSIAFRLCPSIFYESVGLHPLTGAGRWVLYPAALVLCTHFLFLFFVLAICSCLLFLLFVLSICSCFLFLLFVLAFCSYFLFLFYSSSPTSSSYSWLSRSSSNASATISYSSSSSIFSRFGSPSLDSE